MAYRALFYQTKLENSVGGLMQQKHFDVTLVFKRGGSFGCRFYAESRRAAKAQAIVWARQSGFLGTIKKTEIIELN